MAQDFRNQLTLVTTSAPAIWTAGDYDVVIGIMLCNSDTDDNVLDVYVENSSVLYHIAKGLSLPAGSSVQLLTGGAKLVLANGDVLKADLTTGTNGDTQAIVSVVDTASA